jgi:hypothetical protein
MSRAARIGAMVVAVSLLAATPAPAYFSNVEVGARPMGLAGAWTASAEDVTAYYWNPAALTRMNRTELFASFGRPYGLSDLNNYSVALGSGGNRVAMAVAWHRQAINDFYAEDLFNISFALGLIRSKSGHEISLGATAKAGRVAFLPFVDPDNPSQEIGYGTKTRFFGDAGITYRMPWKLDFGWVYRNINSPNYEFIEGTGGLDLESRNELALAFRWHQESTLFLGWKQRHAQVGSELALGIEIWFYDVFAVRSALSGVGKIGEPNASPIDFDFTGGFGIKHKNWLIDGAVITNQDLGASFQLSLIIPIGRVGLGPPPRE